MKQKNIIDGCVSEAFAEVINPNAKETHSYRGWLNSDYFWKRCLAIQGYQLAFGIIILGVGAVIMLIFFIINTILG